MRVSIVTVSFNAATTIADTLRSVAEQTYPSIEHIVIDGGSTDGTQDIVRQFPHLARMVTESDSGLYDAMNKGWKAASGEIVGWLNADDTLAGPEAVSQIVSGFRPEVDAVAASIVMVDPGNPGRIIRTYSSDGFTLDWLRYGYAVPHPGFYIRRNVLARIGGYDLRFPLASDFDLIARALYRERIPFQLLPDIVVRMRMGGRSFGPVAALRMLREVYRSCRHNGIPTNPALMLYRYVHKAMQYFKRPLQDPTAP